MQRHGPRPTPRTPSCRHFGTCGGCSTLDRPIAEQLADKAARLEDLLHPLLGGNAVRTTPWRATPLHFRTKLLYPVVPDVQGRPMLGIYKPRSHDVVRIRECRTQHEGLTALGSAAEQILRELELEPWQEQTGRGFVRAFAARLSPGTGELLVGVVTRPGLFPAARDLAERLWQAAAELPGTPRPRLVGVVRSISERDGNFLLGDRTVPLKGRDHVEDRSGGLVFRLRFSSFYQVHRDADALLYRPALRLCGDVRGQRVVDGYGGIGTFGLRFARAGAARVEIVESNPVACGDARHNARANGLPAVHVIEAPFGSAAFAAGPDLLVVDPPRSGLQEHGVARLVAAAPRRVLCVHCSATALERDLQALCAHGYRVRAVELCDLFPHTEHVEVLTLLER